MNKSQFLKSLDKVYCRIGVGKYGVGIIAIKNIPKGIDPLFDTTKVKYLSVTPKELIGIHPSVMNLINDFCPLQDGKYWVPSNGMNSIAVGYYLNHSKEPNMVAVKDGEQFITKRTIKAGEELTVDYNTYDDRVEDFR